MNELRRLVDNRMTENGLRRLVGNRMTRNGLRRLVDNRMIGRMEFQEVEDTW